MPHSFKKALQVLGVMTTAILLLAVLAVGCASVPEAPRVYNQSAMPMPRAPAFSPTTDSPITVGQPGYVEPASRLQPQPKPVRVLPEDEKTRREAGLWASNAPRASDKPTWTTRKPGDQIPTLVVLGIQLPVRPDAIDAYDTRPSEMCAEVMKDELDASRAALNEIKHLSKEEKACLVASEYITCLTAMKDGFLGDAKSKGLLGADWVRLLDIQFQEAISAAQRFKAEMCQDEADSPIVKALSNIIDQDARYQKRRPEVH